MRNSVIVDRYTPDSLEQEFMGPLHQAKVSSVLNRSGISCSKFRRGGEFCVSVPEDMVIDAMMSLAREKSKAQERLEDLCDVRV